MTYGELSLNRHMETLHNDLKWKKYRSMVNYVIKSDWKSSTKVRRRGKRLFAISKESKYWQENMTMLIEKINWKEKVTMLIEKINWQEYTVTRIGNKWKED